MKNNLEVYEKAIQDLENIHMKAIELEVKKMKLILVTGSFWLGALAMAVVYFY